MPHKQRLSRAMSVFTMATAALLGGTSTHAQTKYRLPLDYASPQWNVTHWVDHWRVPYALNVNVRYDSTVIQPSSPYFYGTDPRHRGTDFGVPSGTPVYAAASGVIYNVTTGCTPGNFTCGDGFGNWVAILHADGRYSIYGHLTSVTVALYQSVTCKSGPGGTLIGYSGNTGDSFGAHLHFEIRDGLNKAYASHDPFGGSESQPTEYWYQYALVPDPLRSGYQMHYPATTCAP